MTRHLSVLFCLTLSAAHADVKLPAVFSDHMVLQRGIAIPVWGWADPGEAVTVSLAGQTRETKAGADRKWSVRLDKLEAGQPLRLSVKGKNTVVVEDVLVGEVWLCSGQSNMAMRVRAARDFEQEKAAANFPRIRTFTVAAQSAREPQADVKGGWVAASSDTIADFSAAAFFFAREVHKALNVPVGLINSSVGGTAIELWISAEAQRKSAELKPALALVDRMNAEFDSAAAARKFQAALEKWKKAAAEAKAKGAAPPRAPQDPLALQERKAGVGVLFNGMIAPLIPYALRGALWYQGEANSTPDRAGFYQYQLPALVEDWRARWGQGAFPFAWVQLPNFIGEGRDWPVVREGMLKALRVPQTGMAVAIDIGEPDNVHPQNKQEAGRRLALWALSAVYHQGGPASGPLPAGHRIEGGRVVVSLRHTDGGLTAKGGELREFQIAGADRKWVSAQAKIEGNTVVVSAPEVQSPVAVRYGWTNNPACNLYNGAGLPASPFRTDDF